MQAKTAKTEAPAQTWRRVTRATSIAVGNSLLTFAVGDAVRADLAHQIGAAALAGWCEPATASPQPCKYCGALTFGGDYCSPRPSSLAAGAWVNECQTKAATGARLADQLQRQMVVSGAFTPDQRRDVAASG